MKVARAADVTCHLAGMGSGRCDQVCHVLRRRSEAVGQCRRHPPDLGKFRRRSEAVGQCRRHPPDLGKFRKGG